MCDMVWVKRNMTKSNNLKTGGGKIERRSVFFHPRRVTWSAASSNTQNENSEQEHTSAEIVLIYCHLQD